MYAVAWSLAAALLILVLIDIVLLYTSGTIHADRILPGKFSNSDENEVGLLLSGNYNFTVTCEVIDEVPVQFQKRDFMMKFKLQPGQVKQSAYYLRPVTRGEYFFGKLNIFTSGKLQLVKRRSIFSQDQMLKVYPSFVQMKELDFLATVRSFNRPGLKKMRRIGHTMEFEQIKEYVPGEDVRTINWKATAKHAALMVNQFQDEKSQPVYSVIDTGRVMKMPFEGLSLLDYAINSSLAFSNIALKKKDKVGLVSFSNKIDPILKADSKKFQLKLILERLYNIDTNFNDSDFSLLYGTIKQQIPQRGLLMIYTNFEHISGLKKRLPFLRALAKNHMLVVIFFENTTLTELIEKQPDNVFTAAQQTIAEEHMHDKKLMMKELQKNGIQAILSKPEDLSMNTINKYLEIKARGLF